VRILRIDSQIHIFIMWVGNPPTKDSTRWDSLALLKQKPPNYNIEWSFYGAERVGFEMAGVAGAERPQSPVRTPGRHRASPAGECGFVTRGYERPPRERIRGTKRGRFEAGGLGRAKPHHGRRPGFPRTTEILFCLAGGGRLRPRQAVPSPLLSPFLFFFFKCARISDRREQSGAHGPEPLIPPRPPNETHQSGVWGVGEGFGGRGGRGAGVGRPHARTS
jgi:hypothetical protein